jgi:hypothetical protein
LRGVSRDADVVVAFPSAAHFRNLDSRLKCEGYCAGLDSFESSIAHHVMDYGTTDCLRLSGRIDHDTSSVRKFIRFGFGRIQRDSFQQNWSLHGTTMPGVNIKAFKNMPLKLRHQLLIIFEEATRFTSLWHKDSFPDEQRNKHCAGYLNGQMGFPQSTSLFEFFDIFLSRNTTLPKHCDVKNCHRPGYNECCVYSFNTCLSGEQYKISIIMTTRTTVGCAFDKTKH